MQSKKTENNENNDDGRIESPLHSANDFAYVNYCSRVCVCAYINEERDSPGRELIIIVHWLCHKIN
jgi:5-hydroxyisourate hydrolase-like protein (transthyretin family)